MKPAPFQYYAPTTVEEALTLLAENAGDGKLLAGGQSLVPAMNFRLAQPAALIDLNGVPELAYIRTEGGGLQIGAMTRQRSLERSPEVAQVAPLLAATMPYIAHTQIRNRGTLGGSLAHADPAAELPAVMVALDALFHLANLEGRRVLRAADFYQGLFTTALEPEEMLVRIDIPARPQGSGWSFHEFARRHGDYAIVGVAAVVQVDAGGPLHGRPPRLSQRRRRPHRSIQGRRRPDRRGAHARGHRRRRPHRGAGGRRPARRHPRQRRLSPPPRRGAWPPRPHRRLCPYP